MSAADPDCKRCRGDGGWYWEAPIGHNERVTEWMSCACHGKRTIVVNPGLPTETRVQVEADE
jgi:hypothetical protein